jgi:hypothetical protein
VSLIERGHLDRLSVAALRRAFGAVDARFQATVLWRGGDVERLVDLRHARIQVQVVHLLSAWGWQPFPEVSYARYGERGSIDVLALHRERRIAVVFEIKTEIGSLEATHRKHDEKVRLTPSICFERWGWRPALVARILVLRESPRLRRIVVSHRAMFDAFYPASSREVRRWLQTPDGTMGGLWFLTPSDPGAARRTTGRSVAAYRRLPEFPEHARPLAELPAQASSDGVSSA